MFPQIMSASVDPADELSADGVLLAALGQQRAQLHAVDAESSSTSRRAAAGKSSPGSREPPAVAQKHRPLSSNRTASDVKEPGGLV
ncbi:hypothetical protein [Actinacidiphila oryziradicis]|uniref:Uncharacterized protein n=1 Tax=Actinacidiphila oryziradicis TaxID=2571141 RepID=A0A4U0RMM1_9ACTN|nr:hypothetical protein [Actinacidiphila oryziradicis]TJZ96040.1 hypothetical protein FCI23_51520 [Actinacidiphila oryziradicis]